MSKNKRKLTNEFSKDIPSSKRIKTALYADQYPNSSYQQEDSDPFLKSDCEYEDDSSEADERNKNLEYTTPQETGLYDSMLFLNSLGKNKPFVKLIVNFVIF